MREKRFNNLECTKAKHKTVITKKPVVKANQITESDYEKLSEIEFALAAIKGKTKKELEKKYAHFA